MSADHRCSLFNMSANDRSECIKNLRTALFALNKKNVEKMFLY